MALRETMEEKIKTSIKDLKIQTTKKLYLTSWICLGVFPLLAVIAWGVAALIASVISIIGIFLGFGLLAAGICLFFVFRSQGNQISKKNQRKMINLGASLHHSFFENYQDSFPQELEFKGFGSSEIYGNNCLIFHYNDEIINWNISENYYSSKDGNTYILKFYLVSTAKKFAGLDNLYISEEKTEAEEPFFKSESILFNERFKVEGNNKIQVYKILTPKIIENFLLQENNFLYPKTIRIYDGRVSIAWKGSQSGSSWNPDPLDYSGIHWTKNLILGDIYQKIANDFGRYLDVQEMLIPLDLY